uniref:RHS repeat domain-containing protein n=1 Tax=Acetatifactor sp. TaxID=1872090 RepID=UPI004056F44A
MIYNDHPYYFRKNLQGDVIAITDWSGETVVRYTYDAWGKCTIVDLARAHEIATINPFRYRSYYYNSETSLYYLQSRYYDPETGRFINGDEILATVFAEFTSINNSFAYCNNSVTNYTDQFGFAPKGSEVPPESSGYVPPKGGPKKGKTKSGKTGWVDKNGNIWVPDPSNHGGDHWDVEGKEGYINVGRNGHTWGGKGKVKLPKASKKHIEFGRIIRGILFVLLVVVVVYLIYQIICWLGSACVVIFA